MVNYGNPLHRKELKGIVQMSTIMGTIMLYAVNSYIWYDSSTIFD